MKTAFCPLCNTGIAIALKDERKKGWKMCPHCGEPAYVEVSEKVQSAVPLSDTMFILMKKPAGRDLIYYLLKHDDNSLEDLLFHSSKGLGEDIISMNSSNILNKSVHGYTLNPELKPFIDKYYQKF